MDRLRRRRRREVGKMVSNSFGQPELLCNNQGVEFVLALAQLDFYNSDKTVEGKLVPMLSNTSIFSTQGLQNRHKVKMGDCYQDSGFHGKRRSLPCRGQVKAAIVASLARSVASVTLGITSTVKRSLSRHSKFSRMRSNASSFSSHSSSTHSQVSGRCSDADDYVEDTADTDTVAQ